MNRLPDVSLLNPLIDLALGVDGAFAGCVQLLIVESRELQIVAQRGFRASFLQYFRTATENDGTSYGQVLLDRRRILISDTHADPAFGRHVRAADDAGFRAVMSTPLIGHNGSFVGVLSTHYARPHTPLPQSLGKLDLLASLAARIIESSRLRTKIEDGALARGLPLPSLSASALSASVSTRELMAMLRERGMDVSVAEAVVGEFDRLLPELQKFARIW